MNYPRISIVTPSFNQADFLEICIDSVHSQKYPNLQHIVIDGGSTDGSLDIIKRYSKFFDFWVSEPDRGHTDALIKGFSKANGQIYAWLNSDDAYEPNSFFYVSDFFLSNTNSGFVFGDCNWIDVDGNIIKKRKEIPFIPWIWLYGYNYIPQPASFWTSRIFEKVGGLDFSYQLSMDADIFIRFSKFTRLEHLPITLANFRFYPQQRNQFYREFSDVEENKIFFRETGKARKFYQKNIIGFFARLTHWILRNSLPLIYFFVRIFK
ncbi:MAG TPA: glycosyltransferase [Candidatus Atribacteria bacterium]|nr:glycosyltransferase [Candidatus Atribacteria bacterium]